MSVILGTKWSAIAAENETLKLEIAALREANSHALEEVSSILATSAISEAIASDLEQVNLEISSKLRKVTLEVVGLRVQLEAERNRSVDAEISVEAKIGILARLEEKFEATKKVSEKLATGLSVRDAELKNAKDLICAKSAEIDRLLRDVEIMKKNGAQKDSQIAALQKRSADASSSAAALRAALDLQRASTSARRPEVERPKPRPAPEPERRLAELEAENVKLLKVIERERAATRARAKKSENPWEEVLGA